MAARTDVSAAIVERMSAHSLWGTDTQAKEVRGLVKTMVEEACEPVYAAARTASDSAAHGIAMQCNEQLDTVRGVVAMYRMTNKPLPTRASVYVRAVMRCVASLRRVSLFALTCLSVCQACCIFPGQPPRSSRGSTCGFCRVGASGVDTRGGVLFHPSD
jgi:hypothetical protein